MRSRKKKTIAGMLVQAIHRTGCRICAVTLIVSMLCGSIGYATIASKPEEKNYYEMQLERRSLYQSLQTAIKDDRILTEDLVFRGEDADDYAELFTNINLYELTPKVEGDRNDLKLRVFARIEGEIPLDSNYEIVGSEEFIFLLVNESKANRKTVIRMDEKRTEPIQAVYAGGVTGVDKMDTSGGTKDSGSGSGSSFGSGSGSGGSNVPESSEAEKETVASEETGSSADDETKGAVEETTAEETGAAIETNGTEETAGQSDSEETEGQVGSDENDDQADPEAAGDGDSDNANAGAENDNNSSDVNSAASESDHADDSSGDSGSSDSSSNETGGESVASISHHKTYCVMAVASPSDSASSSNSKSDEPENSGNQIEGTVYQAVLLDKVAVTAFVTTAEALGLTDEDVVKATPSNATPSNAEYIFEADLDKVNIKVYAEKGVLPEDAELRGFELAEDSEYADKFREAKDALDNDGTEYDGILAYDISFCDQEENEIEPDGDVRVLITMNTEVLSEEADPESLQVQHHAETKQGVVVEPVADAVDFTDGVVEISDIETVAEFMIDSFSTFTITWKYRGWTYFKISVTYVDNDGNPLDLLFDEKPGDVSIMWPNLYNLEDYKRAIPGYTYQGAVYKANYISKLEFSNSNLPEKKLDFYSITGSKLPEQQLTYVTETVNVKVNLVYAIDTVTIVDTIKEDGFLTATHVVGEGMNYEYKWEVSDDGNSWTTVERRIVTVDLYNLTEDGKSLNAAVDKGARKYYRVIVTEKSVTITPEITSSPYQIPYFDALQNGSFESPVIGEIGKKSNFQPFLEGGAPDVAWRTTARHSDPLYDNKIEFVSAHPDKLHTSGETHKQESIINHKVDEAADGYQFAELNAEGAGSLYQDVLTIPGATLYWHLYHRGRGNNAEDTGEDTMYVLIMSTVLAEREDVTTQDKVMDIISNPSKYPGAEVREISGDNKRWYYNDGSYSVGDNQYLTRFFFVSGQTASKDVKIGNHLDAVEFGIELPEPSPEKGHLTVAKTIRGLTAEDANNYEMKVVVESENGFSQDIELSNFVINNDGVTYVATNSLQNLDIGEYTITEKVTNATELAAKYTGPVINITGDNVTKSSSNPEQATVQVQEKKTTTANIENTYTRKTVAITINKQIAGNRGDKKQSFTFNYKVDGIDAVSFKLAHEGSKKVEIPYGATISVSETAAGGYTTTWVAVVEKTETTGDGTACTLENVSANQTITFTNTKGISNPTGLPSNWLPYILMLMGAAVGVIALVFAGTRRRKHSFRDWE